jgi:hypothetical protein
MYYNTDTDSRRPCWVAPNVFVNPVYVPIPNFSACVTATGARGHVTSAGLRARACVLMKRDLVLGLLCRSVFHRSAGWAVSSWSF